MDNKKADSEDYKLSSYDYYLTKEAIAQHAHKPRDECKLLVYDKKSDSTEHKIFKDLIKYLNKDDVLVINETKVRKTHLIGKKATGGKAEITIINKIGDKTYYALIKTKKPRKGLIIELGDDFIAEVIEERDYGFTIKFNKPADDFIESKARVTLPPYIKAKLENDNDYQTVFSREGNSIASPTAGLHFTVELLDKIKQKGVKVAKVNLDVGLGTFMAVKHEDIKKHEMHTESFEINNENADIINNRKGRLFVVGTTSLRAIESCYNKEKKKLIPGKYKTNLFIYPEYEFKNDIYGMITNFHIPKSTLLMLVSALIGRKKLLEIYEIALKNNYKFYSFGDAMLLLNLNTKKNKNIQ